MGTRNPLARRVIAALLLVLLTACHSWRPTTVSPQTLIPDEQPSSVRATLTSGQVITVRDPTMRNDSIVGAMMRVASRDVRLLEVRWFNALKTVGLVLGTAVGVAAVLGLISADLVTSPPGSTNPDNGGEDVRLPLPSPVPSLSARDRIQWQRAP